MEIMDHFANPKNIGTLPHANGIGESGSPQLGNYLQFYLYIESDTVKEARYLIQGRPQAIAAASYVSTFCDRQKHPRADATFHGPAAENFPLALGLIRTMPAAGHRRHQKCYPRLYE